VDDAGGVRGGEAREHLDEDVDGEPRVDVFEAIEARPERLAHEPLHDEVRRPVGEEADVVDLADVRVADRPREVRLALQTLHRHAVEQDGAQMIVGPYPANEGLAAAPYAVQHRIPMFEPTVSADDLSQRQANAFIVKVAGWSSSQPTHVAGVWAYEQGHRKIATLANSYAFGYENAGGFAQTFTEKGGKIVTQLWAPLGTTDYSPYISRLQAAATDAVFVEMVGADAIHFLEQWN